MLPRSVRHSATSETGFMDSQPPGSNSVVYLGSRSTVQLASAEREVSDVSELGEVGSSSSSSSRRQSATKQVTLPTIRRRDGATEAWPDANGDMLEPITNGHDRSLLSNGHHDGDHHSNESSDDSSDEDEGRKAPDALRMEFLDCLMKKEFPVALKLCQMILIYEPKNGEALSFLSLIEEKIALDSLSDSEDEEGESDDDEDDDDDDDDDEESDTDSSNDDDESDTDSESDEEESEEEEKEGDEQETLVKSILQSR